MGSQARIMIIEDHRDIRQSLEYILSTDGYEVVSAPNGRSALQQLEKAQQKPDLIFLDLMMPEIDGVQFQKLLKRNEELSGIPIVILTCLEPSPELSDLDSVEFLTKPVQVETLLNCAKRYCRNY